MNHKSKSNDELKNRFIDAMGKTFGNISQSCRIVKISRPMPYIWCKEDPKFKERFESEDFQETFLDAIDAKLAKLAINDENPTVLIFLAKTKGKKRGYVEKSETDVNHKLEAINITLNLE